VLSLSGAAKRGLPKAYKRQGQGQGLRDRGKERVKRSEETATGAMGSRSLHALLFVQQ